MYRDSTQVELLGRLGDRLDSGAWREFDARYGDLVVQYCRRRGLQQADAEDVRQVVMLNLAKRMRGFVYTPGRGRFRAYLKSVTRNAVTRWLAARPKGEEWALHDDAAWVLDDELDEVWTREWVKFHLRAAMQRLRESGEPRNVEVFERLLKGAEVGEVAADFSMSEEAVHKVKQRTRDRLRELIAEQVRAEDGPVE